MKGKGRKATKRSYRPRVEALEALRLLSEGVVPALPPAAFDHLGLDPVGDPPSEARIAPERAWDAALDHALRSDLFATATEATAPAADPETVGRGLDQLDRYLARAWYRAGIAPQQHDDCSQAVYETLLRNLGRDRFDRLVSDVGQVGIREVLSRETAEGPDFFRAIDMVKKRSLRQKPHQTLADHQDDLAARDADGGAVSDWRGALHEAIARTLNPREATLIRETLLGKTPAEIAQDWGVAPKTVSNEKTRCFQKLRDALTDDLTV